MKMKINSSKTAKIFTKRHIHGLKSIEKEREPEDTSFLIEMTFSFIISEYLTITFFSLEIVIQLILYFFILCYLIVVSL